MLESCESLSTVGTSDHNAILTRFVTEVCQDNSSTRTLWQWNRTDWDRVKQDASNINWTRVLSGGVDEQASKLTDILQDLQRRHVPHRETKEEPSDQPWFGHQCRLAAADKYKAWKKFKIRRTEQNKSKYRQACKHLTEVITWAKSHWFNDLRKKLQSGRVGSKQWWGLTKNLQGLVREDLIPPLTRKDGSTASSKSDKAETLAQHFSEKMTVPDQSRTAPNLPSRTRNTIHTLSIKDITVKKALKALDVSKATGPDGVSPHLLKKCSAELAPALASIFRACLTTATWPALWKLARVVPVYKKKSKMLPQNYRPISLLSVIAKVFEKIMATDLRIHLEKSRLLSTRQFAFTTGKSASDLLLLLTCKWNKHLDSGEETRVIGLDIAGAFDTVWHRGLMSKVKSLGIEGQVYALLQDYLKDRYIQVVLGGTESSKYPVNAGVPQGSLLGPLLWNIFFDDLLHQIPEAIAYADDLTIHISYPKHQSQEAADRLQRLIDKISSWGKTWQIQFAAEKSQSLIISRSEDRLTRNLQLQMDGLQMMEQDQVNLLGVTIDSTLNFGPHIHALAKKASQKLAGLRRILHLLTPESAVQLYKSQIRSVMEYACLSWCGSAQIHLSLLEKVQTRAMKLINQLSTSQEIGVDCLQHRRDVAGLTVLYKAHLLKTPHLLPLKLPERQDAYHTRAAQQNPMALMIPRANTTQFQRSYVYRYSQLWNIVCCDNNIPPHCTMQNFKNLVNSVIK